VSPTIEKTPRCRPGNAPARGNVPLAHACRRGSRIAWGSGVLADSISLSAAVSLKEGVTDVAKAFEAETHDHVDFTFGSSGQLAPRSAAARRWTCSFPAANKEVDDLSKAGVVDDALGGSWRATSGPDRAPDSKTHCPVFEQLKDPATKRVAIGEPKTSPPGNMRCRS